MACKKLCYSYWSTDDDSDCVELDFEKFKYSFTSVSDNTDFCIIYCTDGIFNIIKDIIHFSPSHRVRQVCGAMSSGPKENINCGLPHDGVIKYLECDTVYPHTIIVNGWTYVRNLEQESDSD